MRNSGIYLLVFAVIVGAVVLGILTFSSNIFNEVGKQTGTVQKNPVGTSKKSQPIPSSQPIGTTNANSESSVTSQYGGEIKSLKPTSNGLEMTIELVSKNNTKKEARFLINQNAAITEGHPDIESQTKPSSIDKLTIGQQVRLRGTFDEKNNSGTATSVVIITAK